MTVDFSALAQAPLERIPLFCKNCGELDTEHLKGRCLFAPTRLEYHPAANIARVYTVERFLGERDDIQTRFAMTAYRQQLLETLRRLGVPD